MSEIKLQSVPQSQSQFQQQLKDLVTSYYTLLHPNKKLQSQKEILIQRAIKTFLQNGESEQIIQNRTDKQTCELLIEDFNQDLPPMFSNDSKNDQYECQLEKSYENLFNCNEFIQNSDNYQDNFIRKTNIFRQQKASLNQEESISDHELMKKNIIKSKKSNNCEIFYQIVTRSQQRKYCSDQHKQKEYKDINCQIIKQEQDCAIFNDLQQSRFVKFQDISSEKSRKYRTFNNDLQLIAEKQSKRSLATEKVNYYKKQTRQNSHKKSTNFTIKKSNYLNSSKAKNRLPSFPEMQKKLAIWIQRRLLTTNTKITQFDIRQKAVNLMNKMMIYKSRKFRGSKGWVQKFLKRHSQLFKLITLNNSKQKIKADSDQDQIQLKSLN